MASPIVISGLVSADETNLLQDTRLQAIPGNSTVVIELSANSNDATNFSTVMIQPPDGSVSIDGQRITAQKDGSTGVLHDDDEFDLPYQIGPQGGTLLISVNITGSCIVCYRITLIS